MSDVPNYIKSQRGLACREYMRALLPALRFRAKACGYALALHGSMQRDIDIVAVPWREHAVGAADLIAAIREIVKAVTGIDSVNGPTPKPVGRAAWSLHLTAFGGDGPYLDISVFEPTTKPSDTTEAAP